MSEASPLVPLTQWAASWMYVENLAADNAWFSAHQDPQTKIQAFQQFFGPMDRVETWAALLQVAVVDLGTARTVEPHLDAQTILAEANGEDTPAAGFWGVYAAESATQRLRARRETNGGYRLNGTKPWCSLAAELTHAVVTAWVGDQRQAFAIQLQPPYVTLDSPTWNSRGLQEIPSGAIHCANTPAIPVGAPEWYLQRPGFWWGAIRVAACWLGGAIGMARIAAEKHAQRMTSSPLGNETLGQIDAHISSGIAMLIYAATIHEQSERHPPSEVRKLALRVRNSIYRSSQSIQRLTRELAGPEVLTQHQHFNKTDADLTVYISQHHGNRDEADLGQLLLETKPS